ncbi:MAG: DUF4251 domain-containing protein [Odoribacter sp.]|nr:DUF4251 domain-containing protein [Odoribacter sp.]
MKTGCFLLCFLLAVISAETQKISRADKLAENEKAFQEVQQLIAGRHFQIEINRVHPQDGFDVSRFNPTGNISVSDSIARGHLPFFGRAYSLPYGDNVGIDFDDVMKNVAVKTVKKRKGKVAVMSFSVRGNRDVYQVTIEANSRGGCSVNLYSNNRAPISYGGTIVSEGEE